jgi:hypothetical protein
MQKSKRSAKLKIVKVHPEVENSLEIQENSAIG